MGRDGMATTKTNKIKIGNKHENTVKKIYENAGWIVARAYGKPIYIPSQKRVVMGKNDFFGAFDLIAINPDGRVRLIQVTSDTKITERLKKMKKVPVPDEMKILVVWRGRRKKKVYTEFDANGKIVDEYDKSGKRPDETKSGFQCVICKRVIDFGKMKHFLELKEKDKDNNVISTHKFPICGWCYGYLLEV